MSVRKSASKRGPGRPPEGLNKAGEPLRIRDYPRVLFTMRPATRRKLQAAAKTEGRPEWRIVDDALGRYFEAPK